MKLLDLKYDTFGVDINDFSLKIVGLKKKRSGFSLTSFNEVAIAPGMIKDGIIMNEQGLSRLIRYAYSNVKGQSLKTKYAVISLPEEKSFLQVIQMPKMAEEELRFAVPLEAENYIPLPIEEVYLDFQVISPIKDYFNHFEVLLDAMPKKIVDSYVSCFKNAGLTPLVCEPESEAITRALVPNDANSMMIVLLDIRENKTNFIVFSGNSVRFSGNISVSSMMITDALVKSLKVSNHEAEKLKVECGLSGKKGTSSSIRVERVSQVIRPYLEDLTLQIKKYLDFYRDHSSFEYTLKDGRRKKILLCGAGAQINGLPDFLSKGLQTRVELADPTINFLSHKPKSIIKSNLASFSTAIGLALRPTNHD